MTNEANSLEPCPPSSGFFKWSLSDEARAAIAEIEDNIRMAPHRLRDVILD